MAQSWHLPGWPRPGGLTRQRGEGAALRHAGAPLLVLARWAVARIDLISRWCNGIFEYSDAPDCLLRIALRRARAPCRLAGGEVLPGDTVVELHLWNEHVPSLEGFSGLGWVARSRPRMIRSLGLLASALDKEPRLRAARAIRVQPTLFPGQRPETLQRIFGALAFEPVPLADLPASRLRRRVDDGWLYVLAWTFNPRSMKGRSARKKRFEFWISRDRLIERFGRTSKASG